MPRNFAKDHSLEHLMALAQQGEQQAYAQVFHKITPILRSFVGKKLNRIEDTEDVVQEILISIHQASHTYDSDRPFKVWMFSIARYRLNDYLRTIYGLRKKGIEINFEDESYGILSKENVTKTHEDQEYLNKIMRSLPAKQRKIVTMIKINGYSIQETALAMDMSESAVKVSAHRAYKILAQRALEIKEIEELE
ncbi:MAG: RNA polymerase subunit sigma-24 [Proteobacteria bacterium]|nr:MAG: RNA polymerase subunit sigma-24 [Pseudomonadota bacterium]